MQKSDLDSLMKQQRHRQRRKKFKMFFAKVSSILMAIGLFSSLYLAVSQRLHTSDQSISQICLGCLCQVSSGCNITLGCDGPVCGPFYITRHYWVDAGKPTLNSGSSDDDDNVAYPKCANDVYCAGRIVQAYMEKFRRDCTGNGVIDCDDYVRIHRLGASGCTNPLNRVYEVIYQQCMQTFKTE